MSAPYRPALAGPRLWVVTDNVRELARQPLSPDAASYWMSECADEIDRIRRLCRENGVDWEDPIPDETFPQSDEQKASRARRHSILDEVARIEEESGLADLFD